jgi:cysteine desulfurase
MFIAGITAIPTVSLTNKSDNRLPGIISIVIGQNDFNNERFIKRISDKFALSTGSACSAGEPSYVITALGLEDKVSKVLRISLNKYTTEGEVNQLIKVLREEL